MKKIVVVEGWFEALTDQDKQWFAKLRREYGRIHVVLWPDSEVPVELRRAAVSALPYVWEVHVGKAEDVLPYLRQQEPEATIRQAARPTRVFEASAQTQGDLFGGVS